VQSELSALRRDAAALQMLVDGSTSTVAARPDFDGPPVAALIAEMQLQRRLNTIVAQADSTDCELAAAIDMADGDLSIPPGPHDNRPPIQAALSKPLPDDPKEFTTLWNQLCAEEKDWLYDRDHNVGNNSGMPWDPPDHMGKDHYNRMHLAELQQRAQADVDRVTQDIAQVTSGSRVDDGAVYALLSQLSAANDRLAGYTAMSSTLASNTGPQRYLGLLDEFGCGAVSVGNPDTASRNAIFVPGTGQGLARMPFSDEKALAMYTAARAADPSLRPDQVAVTTWMGYDRPMDLSRAAFPQPAYGGAGRLDTFENGQRASHVGTPSIDTVIGHSYGSTVLGAAAARGHHLDADNVIAVGSPGMLVERAGQLSLRRGAGVYVMRAAHDAISVGGIVTDWTLGTDPTEPGFGATRLAADPGPPGPFGLPSIDAHSGYWSDGNVALRNFGAVIAGLPPSQQ
jgi:hypothetical protein